MDCALDRAVQEPTRLLDWAVQTASLQPMATTAKLTRKGAATRARIVASAADHILARGVSGTTLDDIRAGTTTSKGQLFHYFPGGKSDLVAAIAAFQSERVLDAQRPFLETLDSWEAWDGWRAAVIAKPLAPLLRLIGLKRPAAMLALAAAGSATRRQLGDDALWTSANG